MTINHNSSDLSNQLQLLEEENKQLRNKLSANKKAQERYETIWNSFEEWYYEINLKGDLTYFSPSICKLTGYSENELQGKNYRDYTSAETANKIFQIYNNLYLMGKPAEFIEYEVLGKGGKAIYVEASVYLLHDSNGNPSGFQGFAHDITDRKKIEMALQESEKRYRLLAENMTDNLWTFDIKTLRYTYLSPSVYGITGFTPEETINLTLKDFMTPSSYEVASKILAEELFEASRHYNPSRSRTLEVELHHKEGRTVWTEASVRFIYDNDNQPVAMMGVTRDISKRKCAEEALRISETFRKQVFDSSRIPIVVMDVATGKYIDCNPAAVAIYEFSSREETLNKTPMDASAPVQYDGTPSAEKVRFYMDKAHTEGSIIFEWRHQRPGGEVWDAEVHLMSFRDGQRELLQFSLIDITERRKVDVALQESEKRYRMLADNITDVLFTMDMNWNYTFVSPSVKKLIGYEPEELIGTPFFDNAPPLTRKKIVSLFNERRDLEASGQSSQRRLRNMELEVYRKDGSLVWVESNTSSLWDENRQFIGIIGISRDVTERRLMTERIKESEEKFRTLAERCPFAIMIFQNDYWVYVNPVVEAISGYTPEEFYRMRFWEVVHPDHREMVQKRGRKRQSGQPVPQSYDLIITHKTGREVWVSLSGGNLMYEGKPAGLITIMDITERKKTEAALQESEKRYRLLADNVSDNIWIFDLETMRFSYVSPSITGITGFTEEEAVGSRLKDAMTPLAFERINKILEEELAAARQNFDPTRSRTIELEFYQKNSSTVWTETIVKFIYDQKSQPIALLGATRDISERKKLQEQLLKSQKMESLGLLAGGVAHDLNNVLSGIVSYPELLLMNLPDDSKLRKPLKTIMESGNRAAAIVQDLLTIARGVAIIKEPVKLNDLVSDYFDSPEFKKLKQFYPGVTFKTHLAEDLLNINASDVHIRKLLMNLIANAAEAVKERGNVSVSTDNCFLDRPLKGYEKIDIGEYAVLSVTDDGPGISNRDLQRIFEPFYTKKKMGRSGTGLGLSVVWNVMRDHKGYIDIKSDASGTLFELYLPISREAVLKRDINLSSLTSYRGNGETILVIDDIESQREISSMMLDMLGYNYKAVSSGEKAIEYLKQNTVDLILLDMIMDPGINGFETYKRIIKIHPHQKAVILSGFSETDDVKKTQSLGVGKYLKKPITLEKLGMAIKEELAK